MSQDSNKTNIWITFNTLPCKTWRLNYRDTTYATIRTELTIEILPLPLWSL